MNATTKGGPMDQTLDAIADPVRREVLSILKKRTTRVSTEELATHVVAALTGEPLVDVSREERDRVHVALGHSHLPRLADANLVEWSREDSTVTTTDHAALQSGPVQRLIEVDTDDYERLLRAIRSTRRRIALSIIESVDDIERRDLARRVADREDRRPQTERSDVEDVLVTLHHVHLPKLQDAGLVAYEDETVRYVGHPDLEPELLDVASPESSEDGTAVSDEKGGIRSIEGRENIVARGQSLVEQADDELFLMITTDGLIEKGCLRRLEDAVDRGVDVYLGSQSSDVRDLVRQRFPEVVIWEPQLDWLNLPPEREKVGRLVMADREAVLVGTLGEQDHDGYREMAITGAGADNALVVLLRRLLGDRLDHLDAQSEEFLTQLPL